MHKNIVKSFSGWPGSHRPQVQMPWGTTGLHTGQTLHCWTDSVHCCHNCSICLLEKDIPQGENSINVFKRLHFLLQVIFSFQMTPQYTNRSNGRLNFNTKSPKKDEHSLTKMENYS